ncbi:protein TIME FOR COFFEE isoform X2 [Lycium barbarum]|uniref:protein TIME FOR COFFEE isoform X2 n=1 Tax=Lycium barbarum TaxID=112863 RepID=UPI00293ED991|nr:protein TIME FOR COFFEE isoform X2 [Lycium barbarum]
MDRNREARRSGMVTATSNGLSRRRHRSNNSLRDSPDEEGGVEIQESVRLRERVKKDRDHRERDRDRDRDRDRRSKRRRGGGGDRLLHGGGVDDSSEESVNDDEDDDDDETTTNNNNNNNSNVVVTTASGSTRLLPPNPVAPVTMGSSSISNHHHHHNHSNNHNNNHHLQPRKSFPPNTGGKVFRATAVAPVWKPGDEMIGVSVPRKARSATKRSHDFTSGTSGGGNSGVVADQVSTVSPVRQNIAATSPSPAAPLSPSSSNISVRKKIKPSGQKRPPVKSPPKASSSSNPEELEFEIAEVLFGLKSQSQGPNDTTREVNNNRSRVSSPVSNSNSSATPLSAVAPKRKRPRQVLENPGGFGVRSSPKVELDQTAMKLEVSSPNLEKTPQSEAQNGVSLYDLSASVQSLPPVSDPVPEPMKVESEAKRRPEEKSEFMESKEEVSSPKKESSTVGKENINREDAVVASTQVVESQREEKFQIDLMAPPPQLRSSPEREGEMDFGSAAVDDKSIIAENIVEMKLAVKEKDDERINKADKEEVEEKKTKAAVEEINSHKTSESSRGRNINLDLDLEKPEKDSSGVSSKFQQHQSQKLQQQHQPQPPQKATKEESILEKTGQSSSLPMPMSMASWPGGLPPMGYMAPLQGVVAMDASQVSSAPMQPLFSQPRPKRCATHCYIARNINCLQQFMKMPPFWPPAAAAAGTAPFFGAKTNLNVMPSADLHGNLAGRGASAGPDKGQGLTIFPTNGGKDKVQPANIADAAQRKQQILLQQALPPVAPNNLLHGPAFIFPINQQQAAAAAAARPGPAKSPSTTGPSVSSNTSNSAAGTAPTTAGGAATAISFNYPNMSPNEAQYLAILQNNAYAFPIPATVGGPPNYRGTHPQPMPLFNGSFYPSQMIHPSQVQQQQQQQLPPTSQSQQMQQGQHPSMSSGSSSSQKHLQNQQQQRSQGNAVNGGSGGGNLHNFPGTKSHPSQSPAHSQNQHMPPQTRHIENEVGSEDSPSTAERKRSHGPINVYNQNFAMPMHPSNFGLMTPPANFGVASSAGSGNNHQTEKKPPQQQLQPGLKTSLESVPPQPFVSFASFNGATAGGIDMSMAPNHAIFQSLPEATRQNLQNLHMATAAAAQAVQQKKSFRVSEDGKSGSSDQSGADGERKGLSMKPSGNAGQSIAFSRSDMSDAAGSTIAANSVIDSSSRSLNLPSGASWNTRAAMPNAMGAVNFPNAQQFQAQIQHQQQQQQHMIQQQLHKHQQQQQQQMAAAVAPRSKSSASSNGNVYSDHLTSSASAAAKFPNAMSAFPQNLVQSGNNSSQVQSHQWKSSTRTSTSQAPPSLSSNSSLKNLSQQPQQQVRSQQSHTQISFGANQKSAPPQGQQPPNNNQSPSSPMMVGSPTTSSISKGASGSPRHTTSASTSNKTGQNSLSQQQVKSSSSVPNQKSSPAGGRNVPSILGNPHIASTSGGATKSQMQQQQQQQHLPKSMQQQAQLFFSSPYVQPQPPHSTGTSSTGQPAGGYYLQRRRPDQSGQQPPGSSGASSSNGMLTLCPVTLGGGTTSDPAKAIAAAAAANNMKGGVLPPQGILHAAQYTTQTSGILPAGFSYVHPVPAAVQVKPAEQKQPAGNDNLHACWQPEKK